MAETPRSVAEIEEQLGDLRSLIQQAQALGTLDFASQMQVDSFVFQEALLVEELKAAHLLSSETVVQVAVDGKPVESHSIDARFLGGMLLHLQDLTNAMAQVFAGMPTRRGSVHERVQSENRLLLSNVMPTSFGLNFVSPQEAQQSSLFGDEYTNRAISALVSLFNGDTPPEDFIDLVAQPRVKKHYTRIVELISQEEASVQVRTREYPLGVSMSAAQASSRKEWLGDFETDIRSISVVGTLTSASVRLNNFEIIAEDQRMFAGKMSDHATAWARRINLGSRVSAEMRVTTLIHKDTGTRYRSEYFLRQIERLPNSDAGFQ